MKHLRPTQRLYRVGLSILALGSLVPTGICLFVQVAFSTGPFGPPSAGELIIMMLLCAALAIPFLIVYGVSRDWPWRVLLPLAGMIVCIYALFAAQ